MKTSATLSTILLAALMVTGCQQAPAKTLTWDLGNHVTMKLVLIPAGKFVIGSPDAEQRIVRKLLMESAGVNEEVARAWIANEIPQNEVTISKSFYMGVYEVTQEQYAQVMEKSPSHLENPRNPVETGSWDEAMEFCGKLSAKTGMTVRLPTEAEWEYACRAGTSTPFNTGETISTEQANYNGNFVYGDGVKGEHRGKPTPVGTFKPNAFGLYDMHGNVWERCLDWDSGTYHGKSPKVDPTGPAYGDFRVVRGGCWNNAPWFCRSAYRDRVRPHSGKAGFRVVVAGED